MVAAFGYTIAAILITGGILMAAGIVGAMYLGISAARPELLRRRGDDGDTG